MAEGKGFPGFDTSTHKVQEAFVALGKEIDKKKTDWEQIYDEFDQSFKIVKKTADDLRAKKENPGIVADTYVSVYTGLVVCKLGIQLTEMQERLAAIEKTINDIKLALK